MYSNSERQRSSLAAALGGISDSEQEGAGGRVVASGSDEADHRLPGCATSQLVLMAAATPVSPSHQLAASP